MHHDFVPTRDNMRVGEHKAFFSVYNDARTKADALLSHFTPAGHVKPRQAGKARAEKLLKWRKPLPFNYMGARYVHNRRGNGLHCAHHRRHAGAVRRYCSSPGRSTQQQSCRQHQKKQAHGKSSLNCRRFYPPWARTPTARQISLYIDGSGFHINSLPRR